MKKNFSVEIVTCKKINKLENAWSVDDYKALLGLMGLGEDLEGIKDNELREMCMMSLTDFEPHEAAQYVLTHLVGNELSEGKIDQISHSMAEEKLWEEYSDLSLHKRLFLAYGLLREAFNGVFSEPTGIKFQMKIISSRAEAFSIFEGCAEAVIVRLLASGMGENAILNRLYDEKISGESFEEAQYILWECKEISKSDNERIYEIVSSQFWLGDIAEVDAFDAIAHADKVEEEN